MGVRELKGWIVKVLVEELILFVQSSALNCNFNQPYLPNCKLDEQIQLAMVTSVRCKHNKIAKYFVLSENALSKYILSLYI